MFKLQPNPRFKSIVSITRAGDAEPGLIEFEFSNIGRKAFDALMTELREGNKSDMDVLDALILDWNTTDPKHGVEKPYSLEALEELIDGFPGAAAEIITDYRRAQTESRRKN